MFNESQIRLFKTLAVRIVGQWYYFDREGSFCFSLIPAINESGEVQVTKGHENYTATYRISIGNNNAVVLSIDSLLPAFTANIVILTNDSLILQQDEALEILERKPDMSFVNDVLNSL